MVTVCKFETQKSLGKSSKAITTTCEIRSSPTQNLVVRLVGPSWCYSLRNLVKKPNNQQTTKQPYCEQLKRVNTVIKAKRTNKKQMILQHDNGRPHVATMTKLTIEELGWDVLPHPPYSPDLAPTDLHLFRFMSNHLSGHTFENEEAITTWIEEFFDQKSPSFFKRGLTNCQNGGRKWSIVEENISPIETKIFVFSNDFINSFWYLEFLAWLLCLISMHFS